MTTIQLNYVPVWKEDAEYAHMTDAWQDMSRLKYNVDTLAAGLEMNPKAKIVLSTPISVGGSDVPFIGGMTTGGTLAINNDLSGLSIIVETNTLPEDTIAMKLYIHRYGQIPPDKHLLRGCDLQL